MSIHETYYGQKAVLVHTLDHFQETKPHVPYKQRQELMTTILRMEQCEKQTQK